eukprot:TRINITY_DN25076_c0_g1_i1.p1 TRINITY_DN25076_c0_g1~~TRINITY_DN25076_c0_g1_i1.p1  ORF type:complete len:135 (-),score=25.02 TRINITY_DN25076_c0_g1_i1:341-745(-)
MTILQVLFTLTVDQLQKIGREKPNLKSELIDKIPANFPSIGDRLKEVVTLLIEGEDIDTIAGVYFKNDRVLCNEDFGMNRDKKAEDDLIGNISKLKILNSEMTNILTYLVKGVNLRNINEALSLIPVTEEIQKE